MLKVFEANGGRERHRLTVLEKKGLHHAADILENDGIHLYEDSDRHVSAYPNGPH